jgi:hypothetical protein
MVLIVNSKSALDGVMASGGLLLRRRNLSSSPRRSRAKVALIAVCSVAMITIALNFGLPLLIALIHTTSYAPVIPHDCGVLSVDPSTSQALSTAKQTRWANAAFATVDGFGDQDSGPQTVSFPEATPSYVNSCPPNTSACSSELPFTFSTNYTLYREHFGINLDIALSLQVFDTCYRPIQAAALFNLTIDPPLEPLKPLVTTTVLSTYLVQINLGQMWTTSMPNMRTGIVSPNSSH